MLDPILATFDDKLEAEISGQIAETYISGQAEMVKWANDNLVKESIFREQGEFEGPPVQQAIDWAEKHGAQLVTQMDEETKKRLAQTISDGIKNKRGIPGLQRDIKSTFADMSKHRSTMIARTETANALSTASLDSMKDMGIEGKQWVTAGDDMVSDECMGNESEGVIPVNQSFSGGVMAPPQHPNCRCVVSPAILKGKGEPPATTTKKGLSSEDWAKSIDGDEKNIIKYWQGSGYENIRNVQQTKKGATNIKAAVKTLNKSLDRSAGYDGTVFRGLNNLNPETFNAIKNAKTFKWDALASSAKTEKAAARFLYSSGNNQSVMFKIANKTGVDLTSVVGKQEAEVLLRQGAKYRVVSVSEKTYATVADKTMKALEMVLEEI